MDRTLSELSIDPSARERPGLDRRIILAIVVIAAAVVAIVLWLAVGRRAAEVRVAVVREARAEQAAVLNASGYVTPRRRATISAKITGKVAEVLIDEGMHVEAGQVLARLDESDALAVLRSAQADSAVAAAALEDLVVREANAARNLKRLQELGTKNLVSDENLDDAQTAVASYQAQTKLAQERVTAARRSVQIGRQGVENCVVRAPFAGIVVSKDAQPGEMVSPISAGGGYTRTGIATIVDMSSLEIEVDVNESYIARVTAGQRVQAVLDAYPEWQIPATVRTVIPTADREKATVKVRIGFDQLDSRILPDMGVKVSFLDEPADTARGGFTLAARDAVRHDGNEPYAFVVKDGHVERRAIRTGRETASDVEILAGLRAGEQVVVSSNREIHDGSRVAVAK
ncbi:MAG TPA: efflux RND transporter periplasmic adaptor subunit [bacterium]|nr:efflux RND transporter periplasmic adaptor subunit [bacterium]